MGPKANFKCPCKRHTKRHTQREGKKASKMDAGWVKLQPQQKHTWNYQKQEGSKKIVGFSLKHSEEHSPGEDAMV